MAAERRQRAVVGPHQRLGPGQPPDIGLGVLTGQDGFVDVRHDDPETQELLRSLDDGASWTPLTGHGLFNLTGVEAMTDLARRLGITTFDDLDRLGLAIALGGGEVRLLDLAAAYAAFANGGHAVRPIAIRRVEDETGNVLWSPESGLGDRVLDELGRRAIAQGLLLHLGLLLGHRLLPGLGLLLGDRLLRQPRLLGGS